MPKFYCEYCGIYLTHSSPSGRRQHAEGKKHKQNQVNYFRNIKIMMEEEIRARAILKWWCMSNQSSLAFMILHLPFLCSI